MAKSVWDLTKRCQKSKRGYKSLNKITDSSWVPDFKVACELFFLLLTSTNVFVIIKKVISEPTTINPTPVTRTHCYFTTMSKQHSSGYCNTSHQTFNALCLRCTLHHVIKQHPYQLWVQTGCKEKEGWVLSLFLYLCFLLKISTFFFFSRWHLEVSVLWMTRHSQQQAVFSPENVQLPGDLHLASCHLTQDLLVNNATLYPELFISFSKLGQNSFNMQHGQKE